MRLAFADPDCAHVAGRDELEQVGGTLPGRIRNALNFCDPLSDSPGVEIGLHSVHLYGFATLQSGGTRPISGSGGGCARATRGR
ncbi:hypothetical protein GCM10010166_02460 [Couchioplanes caeruleus subsp. azureus]|nr:hypothetical protein GCM10010166_02460 [Couchioplanes caeruleus subsp. azureus]